MGRTPTAVKDVAVPLKAKKKTGFLRDIVQNKVLYIMMLPLLVVIFFNNYLPMAGVLIAFKDYQYHGNSFIENFLQSEWVGFRNFEFFTATPDAFTMTRNTLGYNFAFIFLGLVVSVLFAILINEIKNKFFSKFYQASMLLPYFMSWIVVSYIIFGLFGEERGVVNNSILPALGINPIAWYAEPNKWPIILTAVNLWKLTGYNAVIYIAAIAGIDQEFYEAAIVDGASKWQQIKSITIPLLKTLMIILTLLAVGKVFYSDFGLFFQVPRNTGALYDTTMTIDTYVYNALRNLNDVGMASASGLYQSVCGFVLVMISNLIVRKIDPEQALF